MYACTCSLGTRLAIIYESSYHSAIYIAHELMTADGQIFGPAAAAPAGPVPTPLHTLVKYWSGGRPVCRTCSYAPVLYKLSYRYIAIAVAPTTVYLQIPHIRKVDVVFFFFLNSPNKIVSLHIHSRWQTRHTWC